ncbi:dynamin family protein [Pleionea sp. CnH1-48]|uniref:dynamin family protein n=1 Tax=Pleionea sp. CnH1-48 TaxID=2954494 RepID=UPI002097EC44|nr:dynamin family protein [Pleionea sp. CnH1-48]MCO7225272.1 dynamin family protein [Pleionea sp. CnH1-48]
MGPKQFVDSVGEFGRWKESIAKELKGFRLWLRRNQLCTEENDSRVSHMLESLKAEYLTIAFAGEFSRGKTELINAIFFADYGQRILPSQAGRTTMCPTELLFDQSSQTSYLRLLPIETRLQDVALSDYRDMKSHWVDIPLLTHSPQEMAQAMQSITQTKSVSRVDAIALGFDAATLEESEEAPDKVEIPAWRHAIVSFPHPLLKQGLRIIDTPGLNALGSEPELTFNLLPQAQSVVFVLAADAGVTASDLQIWEEHIEQLKTRPNLGLYAVLNKIDALWDDLAGRKKTEKAINRVIRQTARHLKINETDVISVSAQKALLGKVKDDKALVLKSQIDELENVLSETILGNKESLLWDGILEQSTHLIEDSKQVLRSRKEQLESQRGELEQLQGNQETELRELLDKSRDTQEEFKKRHLTLKPSQRLLERQTEILLNTVSRKTMDEMIQATLQDLVNSRTTVGMMRTLKRFFRSIEGMMNEFCREAELSNKMAESMYIKFQRDFGIELLSPRLIQAKKTRRELQHVLDNASQLNHNLILTLSEQSVAVKRFFTTTVHQVSQFLKQVRKELRQWSIDVMNPLAHQVNSQKELMENHHEELLSLQHTDATIEGRLKALNILILELDTELVNAEDSLKTLRQSAPSKSSENVVEFARVRR